MGALQILSRLAAAVFQLLLQRVPGLASCSPLRALQSSTESCSLFLAGSAPGLSSRGLFSSANTVSEGACSFWRDYGKRRTGAGLPYGVSLERTLHNGVGSKQIGAPAPLPVAEVKSWQALIPGQRMAHLRSLPVDQRWRFLERLEASGRRPHINVWTAVLYDLGHLEMKLENLVAHVEELWEKGYSPDAVTYIPLLEACQRDFRVSEALNIYRQMIGRSVQPNAGIFAVLAKVLKDCYAGSHSGNFVAPRSKGTLHVQAILRGMLDFGVPLDIRTASILVTTLSKVCSYNANPAESVKLVREIQVAIRNRGLVADDTLCAGVLDCHTAANQKGDISTALAAFEEMRSLGEGVGYRTYGSLIRAYNYRGNFGEAVRLLNRAISEGIRFESRSLGSILTAIAATGRYEEAERLFAEVENGKQLDSFIVAAHIKNCSLQMKLKDILLLCEKHHTLFTLDSGRGEPHRLHLVPLLLESLAENPTKEGVDIFCQSLEQCGSTLASTVAQLLRDPCNESWGAFFKVLFAYQARDPITTFELVQHLSDCFWALGRREDSVHLLVKVREETDFLQVVMREAKTRIRLDLHYLMINVGLAMVLVALREPVAKSKKQLYVPVCKGLVVITGKGHRQQLSGGLRTAVHELLREYGFPATKLKPMRGKGGFWIDGAAIADWLMTLRGKEKLNRC